MKTLGFLRRNLPGKSCSRETKTACYNTLVRPIVEYASCVWDPHTSKATSKAESVQRSAARYVMNNNFTQDEVASQPWSMSSSGRLFNIVEPCQKLLWCTESPTNWLTSLTTSWYRSTLQPEATARDFSSHDHALFKGYVLPKHHPFVERSAGESGHLTIDWHLQDASQRCRPKLTQNMRRICIYVYMRSCFFLRLIF